MNLYSMRMNLYLVSEYDVAYAGQVYPKKILVPGEGIEPSSPCGQWILSPSCLPSFTTPADLIATPP